MRKLIGKFVVNAIKWSLGDKQVKQNEVFNSIRINALVSQLVKSGNIDEKAYENELARHVYNMIRRNDVDGRQGC